jgi:ABC-type multidrug transport system fused ATPase/permease subunit
VNIESLSRTDGAVISKVQHTSIIENSENARANIQSAGVRKEDVDNTKSLTITKALLNKEQDASGKYETIQELNTPAAESMHVQEHEQDMVRSGNTCRSIEDSEEIVGTFKESNTVESNTMTETASIVVSPQQEKSDLTIPEWRKNKPVRQLPDAIRTSSTNQAKSTSSMRTRSLSFDSVPRNHENPEVYRLRNYQQSQGGMTSLPRDNQQAPHQTAASSQIHGQNHYHQGQRRQLSRREYPSRVQQQRTLQERASSGSQARSLFKSLLGNVGKGLDELSNIEDSLTKRAQSLVSSATSSPGMNALVSSTTKILPKNQIRLHQQSNSKSGIRTRPQGTKSPNSPSSTSPFAHLGKKYEVVKSQNQHIKTPDVTRKLISANGGASAPYGQTPTAPIAQTSQNDSGDPAATSMQQRPQQQRQYQRPPPVQQSPSLTGPASGNAQATQASSYGSNPYLQLTGNSQKPPPKRSADTHSRESRIPWDTSAKSSPSPMQKGSMSVTRFDDNSSWKTKLSKLIPRLPRLPNPAKILGFKREQSYYASMAAWDNEGESSDKGFIGLFRKFFGLFRKKKSRSDSFSRIPIPTQSSSSSGDAIAPALASLMARSKNGKKVSLVAAEDEKKCRSIGRYHATLDFAFVMFLLLGIQQVPGLNTLPIGASLAEFTSKTLPSLVTILRGSLDTWAPFCLAYAYLTMVTKNILLEPRATNLATSVASSVEDDASYAQLYLRLVAALPMDTQLPARLSETASSQVSKLISVARLNSFVVLVLSLLVVMTVSVLRPVLIAIGSSLFKLSTLEQWRSWPIDWTSLVAQYKTVFRSLYLSLETLIANGLSNILENPLQVAFQMSIFGCLFLATLIAKVEEKRAITVNDDEHESEVLFESPEQLSKLGASSANRLTMLSENGSVENALERWRLARVPIAESNDNAAISSLVRLASYSVLAGMITLAPLLVSLIVSGSSSSVLAHTGLQWDSVLDVSVILLFVFFLVYDALKKAVELSEALPVAKGFLSMLSKTLDEIQQSNKQQADIKFMASVSPTEGLMVRDLWASYTSKRAWAVRGANLQCKNGEILAVLGDDGCGKTRMLTTIAESLIIPPKHSLTSNKVRGLVAVGGLDASKWDRRLLKRRLGIVLSDVRTVGDAATLFSGWTMEEILEPVDGIRSSSHTLSASEKSSIILGLKVILIMCNSYCPCSIFSHNTSLISL